VPHLPLLVPCLGPLPILPHRLGQSLRTIYDTPSPSSLYTCAHPPVAVVCNRLHRCPSSLATCSSVPLHRPTTHQKIPSRYLLLGLDPVMVVMAMTTIRSGRRH
jgi:hypothetical protein